MPTDLSLDFSSAISGTVLDKNGEGTGFTSVQANTAGNAYDLGRIDLNTSATSLVLTATQGSNTSANTLKNALQVPISASTQSFTVSTRLIGPFTNLTSAVQQGGIFFGSDQDNYVKFVIVNTSSGSGGLGLQFYQEQNGVSSSVGGGSGSQVKALDWASINTLDLFLTGNPATGVVTAAYRVNSDTAPLTTLTQQFTPSPLFPLFADQTIARAGILAFTRDAADTTVTFDNFSIEYSPDIKINFQPLTSATPSGYIKDFGLPYNDATGFGWVREDSLSNATATPWSLVPYSRQRDRTGIDPKLDTVLQMQYPNTPAAAWEYAVPNGTYNVTVSVGDQPRQADGTYDSINTINVEGVNAINGFQGSPNQEYQSATVQATVTDGKLTIDAQGGINTKINFIEVSNFVPDFSTINWSTVAPSPVPRSESLGVTVDGKLYFFGGFVTSDESTHGFGPSSRVDMYDPLTNKWTQLPDMPLRLTHVGTEVVGNDVYFAGGYVGDDSKSNFGAQIFGTKDVWKYNVDTQTWTAMPSLPEARASGNLAFLNGNLHYFGGEDLNRTEDVGDHWILPLKGGTSWLPAAELPNPRTHMADVTLDGKIYAIGGQHSFDKNLVTQSSVHVWDPANPNTWTEVASLPKPLSHISHSTFVMDGRIIVAGGEVDHLDAVSDVVAYDPQSNSWTQLSPLPEPRFSGFATNVGNQIFYSTGGSDSGSGFNSTTWKGEVS